MRLCELKPLPKSVRLLYYAEFERAIVYYNEARTKFGISSHLKSLCCLLPLNCVITFPHLKVQLCLHAMFRLPKQRAFSQVGIFAMFFYSKVIPRKDGQSSIFFFKIANINRICSLFCYSYSSNTMIKSSLTELLFRFSGFLSIDGSTHLSDERQVTGLLTR